MIEDVTLVRPGQHQAQGSIVAHQAHMINCKLKALLAPSTLKGLNQDIWVPFIFKDSQRLRFSIYRGWVRETSWHSMPRVFPAWLFWGSVPKRSSSLGCLVGPLQSTSQVLGTRRICTNCSTLCSSLSRSGGPLASDGDPLWNSPKFVRVLKGRTWDVRVISQPHKQELK